MPIPGFVCNHGVILACDTAIVAAAAAFDPRNSQINGGTIFGFGGILLRKDPDVLSDVSLRNTGVLLAENCASHSFDENGQDSFINSGEICGPIDTGGFDDAIINRGVIERDILMGAGDDIFNNSQGAEGPMIVDLGDGADRTVFGAAEEVAFTAAGTDKADYSFARAVRIELLAQATNAGGAFGDVVEEFAALWGSDRGNDTLLGDSVSMTILGKGGNDFIDGRAGLDTIDGGLGNGTIMGGLGADRLTGGLGNDAFVIRSLTEAVDNIRDFHAVLGDDDQIWLSLSLGTGLNGAAITAAQFLSTTNHTALGAEDRIIYDKVHHTLWCDSDATGAQAAILIASFFGNSRVTFQDLHFFSDEI